MPIFLDASRRRVDDGLGGEEDADDGAVRALLVSLLEGDAAAVFADDAAADPEPEAGAAFALGGEEGLEEVGLHVLGNAGAVIAMVTIAPAWSFWPVASVPAAAG